MRLLVLLLVLVILAGCGRKGPPSLPQRPTSLLPSQQKAELPRSIALDWDNGAVK
jgi:predicted small lipoprotein YifL